MISKEQALRMLYSKLQNKPPKDKNGHFTRDYICWLENAAINLYGAFQLENMIRLLEDEKIQIDMKNVRSFEVREKNIHAFPQQKWKNFDKHKKKVQA